MTIQSIWLLHDLGCQFSGVCYSIKTNILEKGKKALDNLYIQADKAPEDYIIGLAMSCASLPKLSKTITTYAGCDTQKTSAVGWNYNIQNLEINSVAHYKRFELITYGNWFLYKNLTKLDRCKPMKVMLKVQEMDIQNHALSESIKSSISASSAS